jgi:hypothetical protein
MGSKLMPFIPVDHDPFAQAQPDYPQPGTPNVTPTGLPQGGDATPTSGNPMSGMGIAPPYQNDQDWGQLGLAAGLMSGGNSRGMATVIQNTPGHQAAVEYAKKIAGDKADIANTQRGVLPMLRALDGMEKRFTESGPGVASEAIGPNYGGSYIPLPDTASPMYQNIRAYFRGSGDVNAPNDYDKAADLNNQMQHAQEGIATLFKAIPGSGKGGSTDQAQETLSNMVGKAIHARDPETFYRIMHDAKNFVRGLGQFDQLPEPKSYLPPNFQPQQLGAPPAAPQAAAAPPAPQAAPQAAPRAEPVKVMSPAQAMKLPSGTLFMTPDGRTKVRP